MRICKVDGCWGGHCALGYCEKHYRQFKKHGKILERTIFDKNKITTKDDICYMNLYSAKGKIVAITKFNLRHLEEIKKYKWHMGRYGYVLGVKDKKNIRLSRLILNILKSPLKITDHIDRNPLNNIDSNLRVVTNQQNQINKIAKGYYYNKRDKRWTVEIVNKGNKKYFGNYKTEDEAKQKAYKIRKLRYLETFGEIETFKS